MDFMKTFLVICLVVTIIAGLYYLVKSLVIVGLLIVIVLGLCPPTNSSQSATFQVKSTIILNNIF